jgi:hypothetical protein
MGTKADHKEKADHNQAFLSTIDTAQHSDWAVTVCFYKALHVIEMMFAKKGRHSNNHRERHDELKRNHPDIWKSYLPIYSQSRRARYKVRTISSQTVTYIRDRLAKVESLVASAP